MQRLFLTYSNWTKDEKKQKNVQVPGVIAYAEPLALFGVRTISYTRAHRFLDPPGRITWG